MGLGWVEDLGRPKLYRVGAVIASSQDRFYSSGCLRVNMLTIIPPTTSALVPLEVTTGRKKLMNVCPTATSGSLWLRTRPSLFAQEFEGNILYSF